MRLQEDSQAFNAKPKDTPLPAPPAGLFSEDEEILVLEEEDDEEQQGGDGDDDLDEIKEEEDPRNQKIAPYTAVDLSEAHDPPPLNVQVGMIVTGDNSTPVLKRQAFKTQVDKAGPPPAAAPKPAAAASARPEPKSPVVSRGASKGKEERLDRIEAHIGDLSNVLKNFFTDMMNERRQARAAGAQPGGAPQ